MQTIAGQLRQGPMTVHYTKVGNVDEERLDDELILLHPGTLQVKVLNETAAVFWDALGEFPNSVALAGLLAEAPPSSLPRTASRTSPGFSTNW